MAPYFDLERSKSRGPSDFEFSYIIKEVINRAYVTIKHYRNSITYGESNDTIRFDLEGSKSRSFAY